MSDYKEFDIKMGAIHRAVLDMIEAKETEIEKLRLRTAELEAASLGGKDPDAKMVEAAGVPCAPETPTSSDLDRLAERVASLEARARALDAFREKTRRILNKDIAETFAKISLFVDDTVARLEALEHTPPRQP